MILITEVAAGTALIPQVFGTSGDHSVYYESRRYDTSDNKSLTKVFES